jgi:DNA-binding MarR family transcriptional regulator
MDTAATPEGRDDASGRLIALGSDLEGVFDRLARRQGNITLVQYRVLATLAAHAPDPLEPWQLARLLTMGSNHVTMVLDQLAAREMISRAPHPHDGRRRLVSATPLGLETARLLGAHVAALEERIMSSVLSDAERAQLHAIAAKLQAAVAAMVVPATRQRPGP